MIAVVGCLRRFILLGMHREPKTQKAKAPFTGFLGVLLLLPGTVLTQCTVVPGSERPHAMITVACSVGAMALFVIAARKASGKTRDLLIAGCFWGVILILLAVLPLVGW